MLGVVMPQGKCWGKQNSIRREGEGRETKKEGRRISVGITKRLSATPSGRGPQELLTQENQNCEFTVYSLVSTGALARTKEGNKQKNLRSKILSRAHLLLVSSSAETTGLTGARTTGHRAASIKTEVILETTGRVKAASRLGPESRR